MRVLFAALALLPSQPLLAQSSSSTWSRAGGVYEGRYTYNGRTTVCRSYVTPTGGSTYCDEERSQPQPASEKAEMCGLIMQNPEWQKHMDAIRQTCLSLTPEQRTRYKVPAAIYAKIDQKMEQDRAELMKPGKLSVFEQRMCELEGKYCNGIAAENKLFEKPAAPKP